MGLPPPSLPPSTFAPPPPLPPLSPTPLPYSPVCGVVTGDSGDGVVGEVDGEVSEVLPAALSGKCPRRYSMILFYHWGISFCSVSKFVLYRALQPFLPFKACRISILLRLKLQYMCMGLQGVHELCPYLLVL